MANFTTQQITELSAIKDLPTLKKAVTNLLDNCSTMHPTRIAILKNNVNESRTVVNIVSMLWNMQLSGEGLAVKSSRYQKNNAKNTRMPIDKR